MPPLVRVQLPGRQMRELAAMNARRSIDQKWHELGGSPGAARPDPLGLAATPAGPGYFVEFERGRIYATPNRGGQPSIHYVYGSILERYLTEGGPLGWLGWPRTDEEGFSEEGRISVFQNGGIYWWPDTGALAIADVVVRYSGLSCFGETDWDQGSTEDEPYGILSATAPSTAGPTTTTILTPIYGNVDGGEERADSIEVFRGRPHGLLLTSVLMEHDYGSLHA